MEHPSPEVAQFLQEIAEIKQQAHRGALGGFQETSSFGEESNSDQVMAVPGTSVMTEVWAKREKGIWSTSKKEAPGFTRYHARWRFPTVGLWKRLGSQRQNIYTQELKVWRIFLTETSLIQGPLTFFEGILSDESYRSILEFAPAMIPAALVQAFLRTTTLSQQELYQIGQECMELWREGGSVRDPHPLLEEVVNAMNIHERFGVSAWQSIEDIPLRTYIVINQALRSYNQAHDLNIKDEASRRRVQEMTGIKPPTFPMRR